MMGEIIEQLKLVYEMLQNLQIQPTRSNMRILCYAEDTIQQAYKLLVEINGKNEESQHDS